MSVLWPALPIQLNIHRIGIIHNGRLLQELNIDELERNRRRRLVLRARDGESAHRALLAAGQPAEILQSDMLWIEVRKAIRSRMPLGTVLGSLFLPLGIAFLIFVSKNPEISQRLGLISAKANLMAYAATDWPTYLGLFGQISGAGGFLLFILIISWIFGREFTDGTLKDMLAVPVQRSSILLAKFIVVAVWSAVLTLLMFMVGLVMGAINNLPGGSISVLFQGSARVMITAGLVITVVLPFAFFASVGRGYLLPIGVAMLTLMMTNVVAIAGWGEYFPWGVPGLYAQGKSLLTPMSYGIAFLTGLAGLIATHLWWKFADQSR